MKKAIALALVLPVILSLAVALAGCGYSEEEVKRNLSNELQQLEAALDCLLDSITCSSYPMLEIFWDTFELQYKQTMNVARKVKSVELAGVESSHEDLKKAVGNALSDQSLQQNLDLIPSVGAKLQISLRELNKTGTPIK